MSWKKVSIESVSGIIEHAKSRVSLLGGMKMPKMLEDMLIEIAQTYKLPTVTDVVTVRAENSDELLPQIRKEKGVYVISRRERIIYIGSAGKVKADGTWNDSSILRRLKLASTPYHIDGASFLFNENKNAYKIQDLKFSCIYLRAKGTIIPSFLEHLLLQKYFEKNEQTLPEVNREL